MRWTPLIEILIGISWITLPLSAFTDGLDIDHSQGEATVMTMKIDRSAAPANPSDWFLKRIRVSLVVEGQANVLFDGLIRTTDLDVVEGFVVYQCASATRQMLIASDDVFAALESEIPWSVAVFGERSELTREEQFEKLLEASNYVVSDTGLQPVDELVKFHRKPGSDLGQGSGYDVFHTAADVIASQSIGGDAGGAIQVDFSEPKVTAGASEDGVYVPSDAIAVAPLNCVHCIVHHRYTRLIQERFNFVYEGSHIIHDQVEAGTNWLTLEAVEEGIERTKMALVFSDIENPPLMGNVGSGDSPVYAGAAEGVRGALVHKFTIGLARRYTQPCERVYEREVHCYESLARYGETIETVEITVSDDTDWAPFVDRKVAQNFKGTGFMDVCTASDFAAFGITSLGTREAAEQALDVLVKQAVRRIKVAHAASLTDSIGSSSLVNTTYNTLLTPDTSTLALGDDAALNTPMWKVSGLVSGLVSRLDASGSATLSVALVTNVAPAATIELLPPTPDSYTPVPTPVGYNGSPLPAASFGGVMP